MSYEDNPVYEPEKYGFDEVVGEIYLEEGNYDFYMAAVLKDKDGYWLSTDSGCSCPSPWESHTREDFTGPLTAEQAREELTSLWEVAGRETYNYSTGEYEKAEDGYDRPAYEELIAKIV